MTDPIKVQVGSLDAYLEWNVGCIGGSGQVLPMKDKQIILLYLQINLYCYHVLPLLHFGTKLNQTHHSCPYINQSHDTSTLIAQRTWRASGPKAAATSSSFSLSSSSSPQLKPLHHKQEPLRGPQSSRS